MSKLIQIEVSKEANGEPRWLELVRQRVDALRYGAVHIVVHDGRVTQVEYSERVRLDMPAAE
jgi:hypothetical protein